MDIQQDQAADLKAFLGRAPAAGVAADAHSRAAGARDGPGHALEDVEDIQGRGMLSREYTITYRAQLEANETLIAGRFPNPFATASCRMRCPKCRSKRASSSDSASPSAT